MNYPYHDKLHFIFDLTGILLIVFALWKFIHWALL